MAQTAEERTQKSIQLTETAAGEVQKLITEEGASRHRAADRVQPGGCSGSLPPMYLDDDQMSEKDQWRSSSGSRSRSTR